MTRSPPAAVASLSLCLLACAGASPPEGEAATTVTAPVVEVPEARAQPSASADWDEEPQLRCHEDCARCTLGGGCACTVECPSKRLPEPAPRPFAFRGDWPPMCQLYVHTFESCMHNFPDGSRAAMQTALEQMTQAIEQVVRSDDPALAQPIEEGCATALEALRNIPVCTQP